MSVPRRRRLQDACKGVGKGDEMLQVVRNAGCRMMMMVTTMMLLLRLKWKQTYVGDIQRQEESGAVVGYFGRYTVAPSFSIVPVDDSQCDAQATASPLDGWAEHVQKGDRRGRKPAGQSFWELQRGGSSMWHGDLAPKAIPP